MFSAVSLTLDKLGCILAKKSNKFVFLRKFFTIFATQ